MPNGPYLTASHGFSAMQRSLLCRTVHDDPASVIASRARGRSTALLALCLRPRWTSRTTGKRADPLRLYTCVILAYASPLRYNVSLPLIDLGCR